MVGLALTLLLNGRRPAVVPLLALLTALTLFAGAWNTNGFVLFAAVNAVALGGMIGVLVTLNLERRVARADVLLPMVLNRSAGLERLTNWVRAKEAFYLSFIDLGSFKEINDSYGHHVGDEVLRAVAERLCRSVRPGDVVMRYGGDEFIVATQAALSGRLEELFFVPVATSAGPLQVQVDIGQVPHIPGDNLEGLLQLADTLMYDKKRSRHSSHLDTPESPLSGVLSAEGGRATQAS